LCLPVLDGPNQASVHPTPLRSDHLACSHVEVIFRKLTKNRTKCMTGDQLTVALGLVLRCAVVRGVVMRNAGNSRLPAVAAAQNPGSTARRVKTPRVWAKIHAPCFRGGIRAEASCLADQAISRSAVETAGYRSRSPFAQRFQRSWRFAQPRAHLHNRLLPKPSVTTAHDGAPASPRH